MPPLSWPRGIRINKSVKIVGIYDGGVPTLWLPLTITIIMTTLFHDELKIEKMEKFEILIATRGLNKDPSFWDSLYF